MLKSRPSSPGDCHCIDCRRSAGAPYVTWGAVPREDLRMTRGEPRKIAHANRIRSFAACCGTHLFFEDTEDSDTIDVTIASLDDPDIICATESDLARRQIALGYDRRVAPVIPEELATFLKVTNNSPLIFLLGVLLAFAGPVSCGHAASEQKVSYGTRVKYRTGQKIEFPDFTVEYVGERRKTVPVYPRGFLYYDFKVSRGKAEKVISWTTGTGVIDPTDFEIDGKRYQLELRRSDKLGKLNENELVIRQG